MVMRKRSLFHSKRCLQCQARADVQSVALALARIVGSVVLVFMGTSEREKSFSCSSNCAQRWTARNHGLRKVRQRTKACSEKLKIPLELPKLVLRVPLKEPCTLKWMLSAPCQAARR